MTPDAGTNLQIVNCTNTPLTFSTIPAYQMASWPGPDFPAVPAGSSAGTTLLQFERGEGDENDAGQLTISWGSNLSALLYGGSTNTSGHYIQLRNLPSSTSCVIALVVDGMWPASWTGASSIQWFSLNPGPGSIDLGPLAANPLANPAVPFQQKAIAIVDLSQIYPETATGNVPSYSSVQAAIQSRTLTLPQQVDLWAEVAAYTRTVSPTLTYSLTNLVMGNNTPTPNSTVASSLDLTVSFDSGTFTHTFTFTNTYDNSVTLTTDTTWTFGASVEVNSPLPFLPGATFTSSFAAGSTEATFASQNTSQQFSAVVHLDVPGRYQIVGFFNVVDDYTTTFTATLLVTGTLSNLPINGTVLFALASADGWNIAPKNTVIAANSVTAAVSGTVTGNFAVTGFVQETRLPPQ